MSCEILCLGSLLLPPCVNSNVLFKTSLAAQTPTTLVALPAEKHLNNILQSMMLTNTFEQ